MGLVSDFSEIEESTSSVHASKKSSSECCFSKPRNKAGKQLMSIISRDYAVESKINQLFEALDFEKISKEFGYCQQSVAVPSWKRASTRPSTVGLSRTSGISTNESVTLKQALRGLCISQASEMASMKRRLRSVEISDLSDPSTPKRSHGKLVIQAGESVKAGNSAGRNAFLGNGTTHAFEMCSMDKTSDKSCPEGITLITETGSTREVKLSSTVNKCESTNGIALDASLKPIKTKHRDGDSKMTVQPWPRQSGPKLLQHRKLVSVSSSLGSLTTGSETDTSKVDHDTKKTVHRTKHKIKKENQKSGFAPKNPVSLSADGEHTVLATVAVKPSLATDHSEKRIVGAEASFPATGSSNSLARVDPPVLANNLVEPYKFMNVGNTYQNGCFGRIESSREKGECSQSSLSSIGEYSSSSGISDESSTSITSCHGNRPHMSKNSRWAAIHHVEMRHGHLSLRHFELIRRLGCGDIGSVYLAELIGTSCQFALKVMDIEFLVSRKKMLRAQTEREILQMLDHPFLPTLYAHFATDRLLCLVMEHCPGGDLHVLRQKQPGKSFSESAARSLFYAAEILLALEYLHMLGVIYRDLKPENVLVREDGHIMLSDFDLSLRCAAKPTLVDLSSVRLEGARLSESGSEPRCIDPLCLEPAWVQVPCFTPKLMPMAAKSRRTRADASGCSSLLPQLVVEPTTARSNSFVGTHEYLAPEIIRGDGHGSAVDWWTFGVFLYELLYGRTPFKGTGNQETLANAVAQELKFPGNPNISSHARDLIRGLLSKQPESRLGYDRGAAEIKSHPFFEGLNWALIRCSTPPEIFKTTQAALPSVSLQDKEKQKSLELKATGEPSEFDLF